MTDQEIPEDFREYWRGKKRDARQRGIPFDFPIEEMWSLWQSYWPASRQALGPGYRKWVLSRYRDQGPYTLSNCHIQTHGENSRERWLWNRQSKPGLGDPEMRKYVSQSRPVSVEGRIYKSAGEAASRYGIDRTTAHNRCQSKNFPDWQYLTVASES